MIGINAYLVDLIADSAHRYTANALSIPAPLCQRFTALLTQSDQNVIEYGCSLDLLPTGLTADIRTFNGTANGNAVDLQTITERERATYIGGFHTHPYQAKYGAGIGIGPSNGDWMEWWNRPPTGPTVAAQFVASGGDLFLIIFRRKPMGVLSLEKATSDTGRLNDVMRNWLADDQLKYGEAIQAGEWADARQMLIRNSPTAIAWHQTDTHQMNCGIAEANSVEYFKGTLNNGPSTVALASKRVLGNFVTSTYWTHSTDPWFG
jgi:hypothetical protein